MDNRVSSESPTAPMSPPEEKASVFEDFIDIFYAPAKVFARRVKSGFGMYLLLVWALMALFSFSSRSVTMQIAEAQIDKGLAKAVAQNPQAAEQIQAMKPMQLKIGSMVQYVAAPIWIFVVAFAVWLVALITKTKVTYGQAAMIVALSLIPRQLGSLLLTLQVVLADTSNIISPAQVSVSPARFIAADSMNPKLHAFLGSLDVFRMWSAYVQTVGVAVLAKVPMQKAFITTGIVFVLFSAMAALGGQ
jgi:hypothetical protein